MMLKEEKPAVIAANATHEGDTGSPEVQIAILTKRINDLTEHLKIHKKDPVSYTHLDVYTRQEAVRVDIEPEKGIFDVAVGKEAVEEVFDPKIEILLEDARKLDPQAELESIVFVPLQTKEFGRIAAQTAKHVIRQGIREAERLSLIHIWHQDDGVSLQLDKQLHNQRHRQ